MGKYQKISVGILFLLFLFFSLLFASGQIRADSDGDNAIASTNQTENQADSGSLAKIIVGILMLVAIGVMSYSGWMWHQAELNEDEERKTLAKKILIASTVAFLVFLAILLFLVISDSRASRRPGGGAGSGSGNGQFDNEDYEYYGRVAAAGNRALEHYYPLNNQKAVPRNSMIAITFREPVRADSFVGEGGAIISDNISIFRTIEGKENSLLINAKAVLVDSGKTIVIKPDEALGSADENIWYTVSLSSNIKKANNELLFSDMLGDLGYYWTFEIGTSTEAMPVKLASFLPGNGDLAPRNSALQINFDRPLDPAIMGDQIGRMITIEDQKKNRLNGEFHLSNLYRTIEFIPAEICAQNSCQDAVGCWSADSEVSVFLRPSAIASDDVGIDLMAPDGLLDINGNPFDGNGNQISQGPQRQSGLPPSGPGQSGQNLGDDYAYKFKISQKIDNLNPVISAISPEAEAAGVALTDEIKAIFNRPLLKASLLKNNVQFFVRPATSEVFYWLDSTQEGSYAQPMPVSIRHDNLYENANYLPLFKSNIKDIFQNCYYPSSGPKCVPDPTGDFPYCCNGVRSQTRCAL